MEMAPLRVRFTGSKYYVCTLGKLPTCIVDIMNNIIYEVASRSVLFRKPTAGYQATHRKARMQRNKLQQ
jgi:hypothetical protein